VHANAESQCQSGLAIASTAFVPCAINGGPVQVPPQLPLHFLFFSRSPLVASPCDRSFLHSFTFLLFAPLSSLRCLHLQQHSLHRTLRE